ncbi:FtsB family cell division protein [Nocardioides alkalitolerans]|uniref:FtsB family cell division protein n=1 Tax=Nocardioides alkalitolerans TaxID=281714 RepID=UPI000417A53F|nr:septum formation initiator family protein [Nocardioides alkalitolerans]
MADERRRKPRSSHPRSRTGPGRTRPAGRGAPSAARRPSAQRPTATARRRPRVTGRAAILLLVLAVLTVSYASSLRAYLTQRDHLEALRSEIDSTQADIYALEREKRRWQDPAYVEAQARERLDYVNPGEVPWQVIDENGRPLGSDSSLSDPARTEDEVPTAWWDSTWDTVEFAGDPQEAAEDNPPPADEIEAPPGEEPEDQE